MKPIDTAKRLERVAQQLTEQRFDLQQWCTSWLRESDQVLNLARRYRNAASTKPKHAPKQQELLFPFSKDEAKLLLGCVKRF